MADSAAEKLAESLNAARAATNAALNKKKKPSTEKEFFEQQQNQQGAPAAPATPAESSGTKTSGSGWGADFDKQASERQAALLSRLQSQQSNQKGGFIKESQADLDLKARLLSQTYGSIGGKRISGENIFTSTIGGLIATGLGVLTIFFVVPAIIGMISSGFVDTSLFNMILGGVLAGIIFGISIYLPKPKSL